MQKMTVKVNMHARDILPPPSRAYLSSEFMPVIVTPPLASGNAAFGACWGDRAELVRPFPAALRLLRVGFERTSCGTRVAISEVAEDATRASLTSRARPSWATMSVPLGFRRLPSRDKRSVIERCSFRSGLRSHRICAEPSLASYRRTMAD